MNSGQVNSSANTAIVNNKLSTTNRTRYQQYSNITSIEPPKEIVKATQATDPNIKKFVDVLNERNRLYLDTLRLNIDNAFS